MNRAERRRAKKAGIPVRELSKDVFYLFYTLKSLDISGVFTEQMCERMCAT